MMQGDQVTRDVIADLVRGAVDSAIRSQIARRAQEPPTTTRVAAALEAQLNGFQVNGYGISVVAQDFRDRGSGSWEKKSGADLYIAIRVRSPGSANAIAKGILIQSKNAKHAVPRQRLGDRPNPPTKTQRDLFEQCEKMLARTDKGAFVWVYGSSGAHVVPAAEIVKQPNLDVESLAGRNVAEQFRDILDCFSGDVTLIGSRIFEDDAALGDYMEDIAVRHGVAIDVKPAADR